MARTTSTTATTEAPEALNLHQMLLAGLEAEGLKVKPKWSPSGSYASYYVGGKNIGYVFKQTRTGVRVEPAATKADLRGTGVKGFVEGKRSERFALVGIASDAASVKQAVAALKVAADKLAPSAADTAKAARVKASFKKAAAAVEPAPEVAAEATA